jgi:hypothetical protein
VRRSRCAVHETEVAYRTRYSSGSYLRLLMCCGRLTCRTSRAEQPSPEFHPFGSLNAFGSCAFTAKIGERQMTLVR